MHISARSSIPITGFFKRSLGLLLVHFFNHQTHHRGQVSTLLFQNGIDPGITDLLQVTPEQESPTEAD